MLDPERAVLIERRDARLRWNKLRAALSSRSLDEFENSLFGRPVIPRWKLVLSMGSACEGERCQTNERQFGISYHQSHCNLLSIYSVPRESLRLEVLQFLKYCSCLESVVVDVPRIQICSFLERKLGDCCKEGADFLLYRHKQPDVVSIPADIHLRLERCMLIRICSQVYD